MPPDRSAALRGNWHASALRYRAMVFTRPRGNGGAIVVSGSQIAERKAWSLDHHPRVASFAAAAIRLGLRISQPLRVSGGAIRFDLPVALGLCAAESALLGRQSLLNLTPEGREIMTELAIGVPRCSGGWDLGRVRLFTAASRAISQSAPDDVGAVITLSSSF